MPDFQNKEVQIRGRCHWPKLHEPNVYQGKVQNYQCKLTNLDPEDVEMLEKAEVSVRKPGDYKNDDGYGRYILCKKTYRDKKGNTHPPVTVIDSQGDVIPSDTFIPNGSEVEVRFQLYKSPGQESTGCWMDVVQIIELCEAPVDTSSFGTSEGGYVGGSQTPEAGEPEGETLDDSEADKFES